MSKNNNAHEVQSLDPTKLFKCFEPSRKVTYCYVVGRTNFHNCYRTAKLDEKFDVQKENAINSTLLSSTERNVFYTFTFNSTSLRIHPVDSVNDIKDCGLMIKRRNNLNTGMNIEYCNEDSCLTHLKTLHRKTNITNLDEWRDKIDYLFGFQVGGGICKMLQIYGYAMLFPIILNLTFNVNVFKDDLKRKTATWVELMPVLLLVYPQYKAFKFLMRYAFVHQDERQLELDRDENERRVGSLEAFLESCLQVSIQYDYC